MDRFTISVKGFPSFEVDRGAKLAYAIEKAGIDISHRCGGNALCTTCRVSFCSQEPEMHEKERNSLDEDGVLGQFRLSCQIRVDRDMDVEVLMRASEQGWTPGVDLEP